MGRKSTFTAAAKRDAVMGVLNKRKTVAGNLTRAALRTETVDCRSCPVWA
jgi:hypothetical protein